MRTAVAILAVIILGPASPGCTVAWTGSVNVDVDPSPLLEFQRPAPPADSLPVRNPNTVDRPTVSSHSKGAQPWHS